VFSLHNSVHASEESPANGEAGSSFRFPPPLRNEVLMVTDNEEDENNKDEKLKKGKGKVANQNSSKKVKTSSRKKKRDETDDAGKKERKQANQNASKKAKTSVSFLSVCTDIQYSLSILTLQTFIFLIDSHRIGENKQSRMNALDLRKIPFPIHFHLKMKKPAAAMPF